VIDRRLSTLHALVVDFGGRSDSRRTASQPCAAETRPSRSRPDVGDASSLLYTSPTKTAPAVAILAHRHHDRVVSHTYKSLPIHCPPRPVEPLSRHHSSRRIERNHPFFPPWPRKHSTLARYSLSLSLAFSYTAGSLVLLCRRQHPLAGMVDVKSTPSMSRQ